MYDSLVTIVTGGGRGLGRAIALRLAKETAVMVVGRKESDLITVRNMIVDSGGRACYAIGDVSDPATAERCKNLCSGFHVYNLVCNAGIGISGPTETYSERNWVRMFEVNVHGSFHFIRTFLPEMIKNGGGNICLISSIAGLSGLKRNMAYSATKHALVGMARSLSLEHEKRGIRSVAICPNFVEGKMTDRVIKGVMRRSEVDYNAARKYVADKTPGRRIIPPEEVAEATAKFCRGEGTSGMNIIINGGAHE